MYLSLVRFLMNKLKHQYYILTLFIIFPIISLAEERVKWEKMSIPFDSGNNDYRFTTIPIQDKSLTDITDVSVIGATNGKVLTSNGTSYEFLDIPVQNKTLTDIFSK